TLLILSLANPNNLPPPPLYSTAPKRPPNDKPERDTRPNPPLVVPGVAEQDLEKLQQAFASSDTKTTTVKLARNVDLGDKTLEFDHDGELIVESAEPEEPRTISMK